MGKLSRLTQWTLQNDLAFPFAEIILFLSAYEALSYSSVSAGGVLTMYDALTMNMIYIVVFLSAIAGARMFSMAIERGEISRQLVEARTSRVRFLLSKFASFYLLTFALVLVVDVAALFVYMGYFFDPAVYTSLGVASLTDWSLMLLEQLLLLFFLDSMIMFLSLVFRSATVSILVFLAVTVLGVSLYTIGPPTWAKDLQLGYGDWDIVNRSASYLFLTLVRHASGNLSLYSSQLPNFTTLVGFYYRLLGGLVLFIAGALRFNTMDLD